MRRTMTSMPSSMRMVWSKRTGRSFSWARDGGTGTPVSRFSSCMQAKPSAGALPVMAFSTLAENLYGEAVDSTTAGRWPSAAAPLSCRACMATAVCGSIRTCSSSQSRRISSAQSFSEALAARKVSWIFCRRPAEMVYSPSSFSFCIRVLTRASSPSLSRYSRRSRFEETRMSMEGDIVAWNGRRML